MASNTQQAALDMLQGTWEHKNDKGTLVLTIKGRRITNSEGQESTLLWRDDKEEWVIPDFLQPTNLKIIDSSSITLYQSKNGMFDGSSVVYNRF